MTHKRGIVSEELLFLPQREEDPLQVRIQPSFLYSSEPGPPIVAPALKVKEFTLASVSDAI
jgi:hypothetical protein